MKKSDRGRLEPSATTIESTDAGDGVELIADGGISRRLLLGVAAALSSLPVGDNTAAAGGGDPDHKCVASKKIDIDYDREKVADTPGGLELYVGMEEESETSVTVSSHPEGIGLRLSNEIGAMSVLLLPEASNRSIGNCLMRERRRVRTMSNTYVSGSPRTTGKARQMRPNDARLTARLISTEDGETFPRSEVGDDSDLSPEAVEATLEACYRPLGS